MKREYRFKKGGGTGASRLGQMLRKSPFGGRGGGNTMGFSRGLKDAERREKTSTFHLGALLDLMGTEGDILVNFEKSGNERGKEEQQTMY